MWWKILLIVIAVVVFGPAILDLIGFIFTLIGKGFSWLGTILDWIGITSLF